MVDDSLPLLIRSLRGLSADTERAGELQVGRVRQAVIKLLTLKVLTLVTDVASRWNDISFNTLAVMERCVIEACADTCLIVCGTRGEQHAEKFLYFYNQAERRKVALLNDDEYKPLEKEDYDWCEHDKHSRVGRLQKHKSLRGHDFRKMYDFLSLFVHTSPDTTKPDDYHLKAMVTVVLSHCCTLQSFHLAKVMNWK